MNVLENILLLTDDDELIAKFETMFQGPHYCCCRHIFEASELIEDGLVPALIVCDLVLPELTGPESLDQLQKSLAPHIVPGIIATSNDRLVLYSLPRPPHLLGVISKKGDTQQIYERLLKLWDEYQAQLIDGDASKDDTSEA